MRTPSNVGRAKDPCRKHVFTRGKEHRLDENRPITDSPVDPPETRLPDWARVKSGVTLPAKVSELRWKLGRKAEQQPRRSQRPFRPSEGQTFYAQLHALGLKPL